MPRIGRSSSVKYSTDLGDNSKLLASNRKRKLSDLTETTNKRLKAAAVHSSHCHECGIALSFGEGDTGQLGLGEDILDRMKPAKIPGIPEPSVDNAVNNEQTSASMDPLVDGIIQVCAGGMHSACLTKNGKVYTFGCNDECGLGRRTDHEEGSETRPGLVDLPSDVKIIQVSAGDSHTAALTSNGAVYVWGTFRDSNGVIGLTTSGEKSLSPKLVLADQTVVKIVSGTDHLVCLTSEGELYTMGCGEQGQLGRVAERFVVRGGRQGLDLLLTPAACRVHGRTRFDDVWAGSYVTFARSTSGAIFACGLNNYFQLGARGMENRFMLQRIDSFAPNKQWIAFAAGQHHTLALTADGSIYSLGRGEYGRLGLGDDETEKDKPTLITALKDSTCTQISCGSACSFAVDSHGSAYSWGMGSSKQLGHSDEEDSSIPKKVQGKNLENRSVLMVSGGGQHVLLLVKDVNNNLPV